MSIGGQSEWSKQFNKHIEEIIFLISQNSQFTIENLWAFAATFQAAIKQVIDNQKNANEKRNEIKNMFDNL